MKSQHMVGSQAVVPKAPIRSQPFVFSEPSKLEPCSTWICLFREENGGPAEKPFLVLETTFQVFERSLVQHTQMEAVISKLAGALLFHYHGDLFNPSKWISKHQNS